MIQNGQIKAKSSLHIHVQVPGLIEMLTHTQTQDIVDVHSMILKTPCLALVPPFMQKYKKKYKKEPYTSFT